MDTTPEPSSPIDEFVKRAERLHIPGSLRSTTTSRALGVQTGVVCQTALRILRYAF